MLESQKVFGQQHKSQQDQETHYTSVCTKFEEFILIDEVMNAKKAISRTPLTWDKIIVTLVYMGKMRPSHQGRIHIVLIPPFHTSVLATVPIPTKERHGNGRGR